MEAREFTSSLSCALSLGRIGRTKRSTDVPLSTLPGPGIFDEWRRMKRTCALYPAYGLDHIQPGTHWAQRPSALLFLLEAACYEARLQNIFECGRSSLQTTDAGPGIFEYNLAIVRFMPARPRSEVKVPAHMTLCGRDMHMTSLRTRCRSR